MDAGQDLQVVLEVVVQRFENIHICWPSRDMPFSPKRQTNGQGVYEKVLSIINPQGNANQNYSEILVKGNRCVSEDVEKREPW
jgi:hypothetical protein